MLFSLFQKLNSMEEPSESTGIQGISQVDKKEEELVVNKKDKILDQEKMPKDPVENQPLKGKDMIGMTGTEKKDLSEKEQGISGIRKDLIEEDREKEKEMTTDLIVKEDKRMLIIDLYMQ